MSSNTRLSLGQRRPPDRHLQAASRFLSILLVLSAGLAPGCSSGRSANSDIGPGDNTCPELRQDLKADAPGHFDGRSDLDGFHRDGSVDVPDLWDAVPRDLDVADSTPIPDVVPDSLTQKDADAAELPDLEIQPDVPFWEGYWDDDVPWDPGLCQSADEGYLPGEAPVRPCDLGGVGGEMLGQHGVFLKQAQSFANEPCAVPQCLEGIVQEGVLLRVDWEDRAAELTLGKYCDWTKSCPWPEPAACDLHKFPPKLKVFVLDLQEKVIHFVRNELGGSEFTSQCQGCPKMSYLTVLEDEVCAAPVFVDGLHPATPWGDSIDYLCWTQPLSNGTEAEVCVMAGFYIHYGITYDVLTDELMNYDYTALTCFAIVDGQCIDLPLGLP